MAIGARDEGRAGANAGAGYLFAVVPTEVEIVATGPDQWDFALSGLTPRSRWLLARGDVPGVGTVPVGACAGAELGLVDAVFWRQGVATPMGRDGFTVSGVAASSHVQLVDLVTCRTSPVTPIP